MTAQNLRRKDATVDAARVEYLLAKKFAPSAYAFLPQLRNSTGYAARKVRTADAVAMSLWPSRGIYLHGFEIKVHRGDWLNELRQPEKAEEIAQFCRYWSLVAAEGVADPLEVPGNWGLIVASAKELKLVREPQPMECAPPTLALVAAMFRNVNERIGQFKDSYVHLDDLEERVAAEVEKELSRRDRSDAAAKTLERLKVALAEFHEFSGIAIDEHGCRLPGDRYLGADLKKVGTAVAAVLRHDPETFVLQLQKDALAYQKALVRIHDELAATIRTMREMSATEATEVSA